MVTGVDEIRPNLKRCYRKPPFGEGCQKTYRNSGFTASAFCTGNDKSFDESLLNNAFDTAKFHICIKIKNPSSQLNGLKGCTRFSWP
jgi:hypothetical protein